jgi:hypothetical protein
MLLMQLRGVTVLYTLLYTAFSPLVLEKAAGILGIRRIQHL